MGHIHKRVTVTWNVFGMLGHRDAVLSVKNHSRKYKKYSVIFSNIFRNHLFEYLLFLYKRDLFRWLEMILR